MYLKITHSEPPLQVYASFSNRGEHARHPMHLEYLSSGALPESAGSLLHRLWHIFHLGLLPPYPGDISHLPRVL